MNEIVSEKWKIEVALQAHSSTIKIKKERESGQATKEKETIIIQMEDIHNVTGGFNGNHRGGNSNRGRGGEKRFDKSNVQCYNCQMNLRQN
jgi:hypothetical protein